MPYPVVPTLVTKTTTQVDSTVPTQIMHVTPEGSELVTTGGLQITVIAAGVATDTVIKPTAGKLCKIVVTTLGTNAMSVYDNASAGSGTIIGQLVASAAINSYEMNMPAVNGITVKGNASNPAVTISWS